MIDQIFNENCLETMKRMEDDSIDLVVTSPPYDNLRDYTGYSFEFETIAQELYRIIKPGRAVVWIVSDQTIDGDESGTSFRQALFFKEIGFKLNDTMIWNKQASGTVGCLQRRYFQTFEYMFIFSKGILSVFNPLKDRLNKGAGQLISKRYRDKNGEVKRKAQSHRRYSDFGYRFNVWDVYPLIELEYKDHPAQFPLVLAQDHVISWSNQNDLIYDPFLGSGTTACAAIKTNRHYLGSEISKNFYKLAKERIEKTKERIQLCLYTQI
jgi:site-specific DNA-methyltransferase (adenine-specific)